MIKINAKGLLKGLARARVRFAVAVFAAVRRAAKLTAAHAKASNEFKNKTGALRRSIRPQYINSTTARAIAPVRHAAWVERGNGFRMNSRTITPKNGPFLVFKIGNRKIVTRSVKTSEPRPFMAHAAAANKQTFLDQCKEAARHILA